MNRQLLFKIYFIGVLGLAAGVVVVAVAGLYRSPPGNPWITGEAIVLVPLSWLCGSQRVYSSESNWVTMGTITQIATIMVLPLPLALVVISAAKGGTQLWRRLGGRAPIRAALANTAFSILSVALAGTLYHALEAPHYLWGRESLDTALAFPGLLAMAVGYVVSDITYVSLAVTLNTRDSFPSVVRHLARDTFLPDLSLAVVGMVFALLLHFSPLLSLLIIVPVYLNVRSFAAAARLRQETEEAILRLAKSVDIRDTGTGVHSQELEVAAKRLATALGLMPEHVHEVALAARAHDLGKIEIGDAILLKRGPLTPEEREIIEQHPVIGAHMLASYSGFAKSVSYVRHHHERWDGKGYPDRLKGEEIPLGARIITVVDSYDAMTANRPYRNALSVDEAVHRLKEGMGTQFDPRVCAAWIQILIEDGVYVPSEQEWRLQLVKAEAG